MTHGIHITRPVDQWASSRDRRARAPKERRWWITCVIISPMRAASSWARSLPERWDELVVSLRQRNKQGVRGAPHRQPNNPEQGEAGRVQLHLQPHQRHCQEGGARRRGHRPADGEGVADIILSDQEVEALVDVILNKKMPEFNSHSVMDRLANREVDFSLYSHYSHYGFTEQRIQKEDCEFLVMRGANQSNRTGEPTEPARAEARRQNAA